MCKAILRRHRAAIPIEAGLGIITVLMVGVPASVYSEVSVIAQGGLRA
jgi:hypothetical protein